MFYPSLDEKKKLEIARLYNTTNIPIVDIAEKVGVCPKTVYNHRNYGYETDMDPTSEAKTEISQSKKDQWECKKCGFITDKRLTYCHNCGSGPFHSIYTKIGSPEHIPYVAPLKEPEITEPEKEFCDTTRDYWVCKECDHISNTEFDICPDCGCKEIVFAPDGNEPRDPNDYTKSKEDISVDEIEFDEEPSELVEESEKEEPEGEDEYLCIKCRSVVEPEDEYCPECGYGPLDWEESG